MSVCCELTEFGTINEGELLVISLNCIRTVNPATEFPTSLTFCFYFKLHNSNDYECAKTLKIMYQNTEACILLVKHF